MNNAKQAIDSFKRKHEAFLIGCESVEEIDLWDKDALGEMDAFYSNDLVNVIIRLIAADGQITEKEVEYLNATFGFEYTLAELIEVYDCCKEDIGYTFDDSFVTGVEVLRTINAKLADAYKELLCSVCEIIMESDGVVAEEELAEVKRLKSLCEV